MPNGLLTPAGPATGAARLPVVRTTVAVSCLAAAAFLLAPPLGRDLAAQVARAGFWSRHGAAVWDLGWYGGLSPYGYSVLTPAPMAWLGDGTDGPRRFGALVAVLAAAAFAALLRRTGARRPLLGALLGTVGIAGNLVSGRITFTAGLAAGLAALLVLTPSRLPPAGRVAAAGLLAAVAGAASPVAGLFTGLAGVALLVCGRRHVAGALALALGAAVPLAVTGLLFGAGGPMTTIPSDTLRSVTVGLVVALVVPRPAVRAGALLSAGGVLAAAVLDTPVGLNAGRLSATFALGVLAAYGTLPRWRFAPAVVLAAVALWQHPVAVDELRRAGDPLSRPEAFAPLLAELQRRGPVGRVEIAPTGAYWEAAWVPGTVPLARGWLRQADTARHPVFFDGTLTRDTYRDWLTGNGVAYVAVARVPAAWPGAAEARLIRSGPPYLTPVWRDRLWTLYAVAGAPSLVTGATLVRSTDAAVTVDVPAPGDVLIRVRWSRWLGVSGGCLAPGPQGWITLRAAAPGRYTVAGALRPHGRCPA